MEGIITAISAQKRPAASPSTSPNKKTNFVGISPLRELTNVKTPSDRPFRVSIEGNIGAGKSTLIKYFANMQGIETYGTTKPKSSTTVQMFERSIQNNRFCFLEQAYRSGYLHGADYAVMDQWYRWIRANVDISLDLIVRARARPEENGLSLQYLTELHESHERWLMTDDERFNTIPVLVLDANKTLEEIVMEYKKNESKIL
ncbi:hypothetical protein NQ314_012391, partial [Rhamnusium bicolor]